jgi:hypothetical protein
MPPAARLCVLLGHMIALSVALAPMRCVTDEFCARVHRGVCASASADGGPPHCVCPDGQRLYDFMAVCVDAEKYPNGLWSHTTRTNALVHEDSGPVGTALARVITPAAWPADWDCDAHTCRATEFGVLYSTHRRDLVLSDFAVAVLFPAEVDVLCPRATHRYLHSAQNGGLLASSASAAAYTHCVTCAEWCGVHGTCANADAFSAADMGGACVCAAGFSGYRCEHRDLSVDRVASVSRYVDPRGPEATMAQHTVSELFEDIVHGAYPAYTMDRVCDAVLNTGCGAGEWCYINVTATVASRVLSGSCFCAVHAAPSGDSSCMEVEDNMRSQFGLVLGDEATVSADKAYAREAWDGRSLVPAFAGYLLYASLGTGDEYALHKRALVASTQSTSHPLVPDAAMQRVAQIFHARFADGQITRALSGTTLDVNTTWLVGAHHALDRLGASDSATLQLNPALVACDAPLDGRPGSYYPGAGSVFLPLFDSAPPGSSSGPVSVLGRGLGAWAWCTLGCSDACGGPERADCTDGASTGTPCRCLAPFAGPTCSDCADPTLVPPSCTRRQALCSAQDCEDGRGLCVSDFAGIGQLSLLDDRATMTDTTCLCTYPSRGAHCEESRIACGLVRCGGNGICDGGGDPLPGCMCNPGFIGDHCLLPSSWCDAELCSGHGRCRSQDSACTCDTGWEGPSCDHMACLNGGQWDPAARVCNCAGDFGGAQCATHVCGAYEAADVIIVDGRALRANGRPVPYAMRIQEQAHTGQPPPDPRARASVAGQGVRPSVVVPKGTWVPSEGACECHLPWTRGDATGNPAGEEAGECSDHVCGHGAPVLAAAGASGCACDVGYRPLSEAEKALSDGEPWCVRQLQWVMEE